MVSIRCLVYNHESFLRQCLDGFVMQQTNFPFEAVVHEDASTDNSAAILREYAEKYPDIIKPIFQTENQYSKRDGSIRRIMNAHMRGKYVAYCEGDDYWTDPHKLQKQVDFLETHPEYSMCFHKAEIVYDDVPQEATDWYSHLEEREFTADEVLTPPCVPTASMMVRADVISQVPTHPDFHGGDIIVHATACSCGKAYCMGDTMAVYRRHAASWTYVSSVAKDLYILGIPHYLAMLEIFPKRIMKRTRWRTAMRCIEWFKQYGKYKNKLPGECRLRALRCCHIYLLFAFARSVLRDIWHLIK